ncbi:MAG: hypothetical protein ACHQEA_07930 [Gaiellales bacterium]|jgi:hypothetical protein
MSFLDKIKQQATDVATTVVDKTQETAKTGQIQIQLRNLKSEEKDALVALGRETYRLHQEGQLDGAKAADTLDSLAASVNDVRSRIAAKEDEIAAKTGDEPTGETVESEAEEVPTDAEAPDSTSTTS